MGKKDIAEKRLEEYNDVFVDIFDNALFGGHAILANETLERYPTETFKTHLDHEWHQGNRDILKISRDGENYRLICGLENQSGVDNTMPERILGADYAAYEEQIREIAAQNQKAGIPAITKRIHSHQKLAPVITAVLNYGDEVWEKPQSLYDMINFPPEKESILKQFVNNYHIHVINVFALPPEVRSRLTSDFRFVAEYLASKGNIEIFRARLTETDQEIKHPEELLDVMEKLSGETTFRAIKETFQKNKQLTQMQEEYIMPNHHMIDNYVAQKVQEKENEVRTEGIRIVIKDNRASGASDETIIEKLQNYYNLNAIQAKEYLLMEDSAEYIVK